MARQVESWADKEKRGLYLPLLIVMC